MTARPGPDLASIAQALVEQRGGRWSNGGSLCLCPAHDDRTPSLSVRVGETSLLFHCFAGCRTLDVIRELRRSRPEALCSGPVIRVPGSPRDSSAHSGAAGPAVDNAPAGRGTLISVRR